MATNISKVEILDITLYRNWSKNLQFNHWWLEQSAGNYTVKEKLYFTPRSYTTLSRRNSLSLNYSGSYFLYYSRTKNPFTDSTNRFNSCFNVDSPWSFPHVTMLHWLTIWCRDGVNVLWCHSHLVWLVCFHSENVFMTCFCWVFFLFCFTVMYWMAREKRGGRGGQGEDACFIKYDNGTKNHHKASRKFKHHTFFIFSFKPHKTQVKSTWVIWGFAWRLINPLLISCRLQLGSLKNSP